MEFLEIRVYRDVNIFQHSKKSFIMEKSKNNTLYFQKVEAINKTYYLNLREAENGANYLVISQVKKAEDDQVKRTNLIFFENEVEQLGTALARIMMHFTKRPGRTEEEIAEIRKTYPNAHQPWTKEDEELLTVLFNEGKSLDEMSAAVYRSIGGVKARLVKLGLMEKVAA